MFLQLLGIKLELELELGVPLRSLRLSVAKASAWSLDLLAAYWSGGKEMNLK